MTQTATQCQPAHRGFALIAVLWVTLIMAFISMELIGSIGLEARTARSRLEALQLERLAGAGHEVADYLTARGLLGEEADLDGLPVTAVTPAVHYRIEFDQRPRAIPSEA